MGWCSYRKSIWGQTGEEGAGDLGGQLGKRGRAAWAWGPTGESTSYSLNFIANNSMVTLLI